MFYGDDNTVTGFSVTRHDGLGIELALKAKLRGGSDLAQTGVDGDGNMHFAAPTGHTAVNPSWGEAAKWNFDFSVLTGLNGQTEDLSGYDFVLRIDTDKYTADPVYKDFNLTVEAPGQTPWIHNNQILTARIGDDDGANASLSQNSVNVGFNFIRESIEGSGAGLPYDFSEGQFDVELIAMKDGVQVAGTHIVVDVSTFPL